MKKRIISTIMCMCLILSGCSVAGKTRALNNAVDFGDSLNFVDTTMYLADGMGDSVCVVKTGNEYDNSDTIMNAKAGLLFNISDNEIVYSKHVLDKMYPASTTKILSCLVAIKYGKEKGIDFNKEITVTEVVNNMVAGAKLSGIYPGDKIKLEDVMNLMMLESGNDAAMVVAENIAGSVEEFVKLMNLEAKRIGATHSNFLNPHGLFEEEHYTTAYDLYLIMNECIKYPEFLAYIERESYTFNYTTASGVLRKRIVNATNFYKANKAYAPAGITVVGGKTGFEDLAGRCLVIYSKNSENKDYISVVLYSSSSTELYENMNKLLSKELIQNNN